MTVNNDIKIERHTIMKQITAKQYAKIRPFLPVQRGNVRIPNIVFINAVLYVLENGCKWRALPERFGKWHSVYARFRRWSRSGVLDRLFAALRELHAPGGDANCFGLDSTSVKVHPDGTGARKTNGPQSIGKSRGGWNTKIHMVSASDRQAMIFRLSGGQANDAPEGRALLKSWADPVAGAPLAMDRAYEGDETRQLVRDLGMTPVVPPKANRKVKWNYDRETYKRRNEIERLFRRFKGYRRLFTRFDKLDATYRGFLNLAAVFEMTHDLA